MEPYSYSLHSPLEPGTGTIRLLKLHPGFGGADLEANLLVRSIRAEGEIIVNSNVPRLEPYEVLSYTWGPEELLQPVIKILAESASYAIPIRTNLDAALRQLRDAKHSRYLWVDSLCINQKDNEEKSSQIPLMSSIYSRAKNVIVWLGPADGSTRRAMEFIKKCLDFENFDTLVQDSFAYKDWAALSELMRRPWFNRRWIIQEIALAKRATIWCGEHHVAWRDFADVVSLFAMKRNELSQLFRSSNAHRNNPDFLGDLSELGAIRLVFASDNLFRKSEQGDIMEHLFSLEALISSMSAFEASDPHDFLYAVLWLANDANPVTKNAAEILGPRPRNLGAVTPSAMSPALSPTTTDRGYFEALSLSQQAQAEETTSRWANYAQDFHATGHRDVSQAREKKQSAPNPTVTVQSPSPGYGEDQSIPQPNQTIGVSRAANIPDPDNAGEHVMQRSIPPVPTDGRNAQEDQRLDPKSAANIPNGKKRPRGLNSTVAELKGFEKAVNLIWRSFKDKRILIDYDKSVFEVCRDFLEFSVRRSASLDMLCRPWAPILGPNEPALPSWVPSLSKGAFSPGVKGVYRRVNADSLVGQPGISAKSYRAASSTPATWQIKEGDGRCLIVDGYILDTIKQKRSSAADGTIPSEWLETAEWTDRSLLPPDSFWRTLVGNRDAYGQRPPSHWRRVCKDAFTRRPTRGDLNTSEIIMYDCPSAMREFLERVQCVVWSRRLVLVDALDHALGIAPSNVRKGDLVCILNGCSVPVLLRKYVNGKPAAKVQRCQHPQCPSNTAQSSNCSIESSSTNGGAENTYYEFIGEVYVHGIMDGEAFGVLRDHKIKRMKFELR